MRLKSEDEILDPGARKKIIEEIEATENKTRKNEAFRRWQVYKDKTSTFVVDLLLEQFSEETVREMTYSITNISLVRKIINKLSRVYNDGAQRVVLENDEATDVLTDLEDALNFNQKMKTQNRMLSLQKNSICYVKPCPFLDKDGNKKMRVRISPMNPYLYDAIEDFYDRTRPLAYVLSNYEPGSLLHTSLDPARVRTQSGHLRAGFSTHISPSAQAQSFGNRRDEAIADSKEDEDASSESEKTYIWWTDKYHFTTRGSQIVDENGIPFHPDSVDDERILNPIESVPIVNFAIDQDNSFWAEGGEDLVDSGVVVNSMLTQINHIGVVQGYGQFFMTGKNLPKNVSVGPNKSIQLEYEEGEPTPNLGFATANPPLRELMQNVESLVALTLTTNNLSTSGVSAQLDGSNSFPSGIAMLIDKAESIEDVRDQRQVFLDGEREIWSLVSKWLQFFSEENVLDEDLQSMVLPEDVSVSVDFGEPKSLSTESEKLENLKKRKELGLNTMAEILMMDQPDLSLDEAEEKLKRIKEQKEERMADFKIEPNKEDEDVDKGEENDSEFDEDSE